MSKLHRLALVASVAALLAAGQAMADTSLPKNKDGDARPDDVICTYEQRIGSHLKRRVCATRQDREEKSRADAEAMARQQQRGKGYAGDGPGPRL